MIEHSRRRRPVIGVLGGMGPLAGAWFMQRLVLLRPASEDQDHVAAVLLNETAIPPRVPAIMNGAAPSPLPAMRDAIERIGAAGATMIAIACNTAHHWHGDLQAATALPVLDMIEVAAREAAAVTAGGPVGVLATRGTLAAGLYRRALARHGLSEIVPAEDIQDRFVLPAITAVKRGDVSTGRELAVAATRAVRRAGADAIVLACTELSIAFPEEAWPDSERTTMVDAGDALARDALARATRAAAGD